MRTVKTLMTGWMPRLIQVFAAHTGHFVGFVLHRLKYQHPKSQQIRIIGQRQTSEHTWRQQDIFNHDKLFAADKDV